MENSETRINNEESKIEEVNKEEVPDYKLAKVPHPKRKYAIIHGYSGLNYSGNQKYKYLF